jgi:hypothetical protein
MGGYFVSGFLASKVVNPVGVMSGIGKLWRGRLSLKFMTFNRFIGKDLTGLRNVYTIA